ncbi:transporter substrate-binding domain-containing protein, partial [Planctomycetota bacterium]
MSLPVDLTVGEREWLKAHREITIAFDGDYAPYSFQTEDGEFNGIAVDFAREMAGRLGIELNVHPDGRWSHLYAAGQRRDVDVIATLVARPERRKSFEFTRPYISLAQYVITAKDNQDISRRTEIAGRTVALVKGYSTTKHVLEEFTTIKPYYVQDLTEALEAVAAGEADATVAAMGMAQHLIARRGLANLRFAVHFGQGLSKQRFGVRKDWPQLAIILDKALEALGESERLQIFQRWSHPSVARVETVPANALRDHLSARENAWLAAHPVVRVATDPDWAPVTFVDDEGEHCGVTVDYVETLSHLLGTRLVFVRCSSWHDAVEKVGSRDADVLACAVKTPAGLEFASFTQPFLTLPAVVFTRDDVSYVHGFEGLQGKRVAAVRDCAVADFLRQEWPEIEVVETRNIDEALRKLVSGEVFAHVGTILVTSRYIREGGYANLKVAGDTPFKAELAMGVRKDWPILTGILRKGLDAISEEEQNAFYRNWVSVKYEHGFDYSLVWRIGLPLVALLLFFAFWNWQLQRVVATRTAELRKHQEHLEDVVAARTQELTQLNKELESFSYSVSHDLRAPLRQVDGFSQALLEDYEDKLDKEGISYVQRVRAASQRMSRLIEGLLRFSRDIRRELTRDTVDLSQQAEALLNDLRNAEPGRQVETVVKPGLNDKGDPELLNLVLQNLLANAWKFTQNCAHARIEFGVTEAEGKRTYFVRDNGAGFDSAYADKLFGVFQRMFRPLAGITLWRQRYCV